MTGPGRLSQKLPVPAALFQDVAVLAYPESAKDRDTIASRKPTVRSSAPATQPSAWVDDDVATVSTATAPATEQVVAVDLTVEDPFTARSLSLVPGPNRFAARCQLLFDDGHGTMTTVRSFNVDRSGDNVNVGPTAHGPVAIAFRAVSSRHFQLRFTPLTAGGPMPPIDLVGCILPTCFSTASSRRAPPLSVISA